VAELLDVEVELVPIRTSGDAPAEGAAPAPPGGSAVAPPAGSAPDDKSRFVKEIEEALLRGDVDLAVHSAKDVPSELPDGLRIVGVPERADARDALCGATSLSDLPEAAVVGTSSLRRRAQLLALRPDLRVAEMRGNVDTRLRRLADGDYDALVLAAAGLARPGRPEGTPIPAAALTPAGGQGCLALEARSDDERAAGLAGAITHKPSLERLTAERALVGALDASCRTPLAAHAEHDGGDLRLASFVGLPDGSHWIRDSLTGPAADPADLGRAAAERLLAAGAAELLAAAEVF
jgi:hydroxymethylbilane synthase